MASGRVFEMERRKGREGVRSINIRRGKLQAETLMDPARAVLGPLMVGGVMVMVMAEVAMVAVVMLCLHLSPSSSPFSVILRGRVDDEFSR